MSQRIQSWWYAKRLPIWLWPFLPLTLLFIFFSFLRRAAYAIRILPSWKAPVPVIVVGNITVGGTGKTPLVLRLVKELKDAGMRPGVVSRGYRGKGPFPQSVKAHSNPLEVGDEPVMLATISGVPVVVSPKRAEAAQYLLAEHECDVIISDDGLQHYGLRRDLEIAVVDGIRGTGNGFRLPCGPLRESRRRLKKVSWTIINGVETAPGKQIAMRLASVGWRSVRTNAEIEKPDGESVIAIAGIGNPQRFFNLLSEEGLHVEETRIFADHHQFSATDFYNVSNRCPVIMTEKDAVKCHSFARPHWYYLKVGAQLPDCFIEDFTKQVKELRHDA